jgi:hypothetical protein
MMNQMNDLPDTGAPPASTQPSAPMTPTGAKESEPGAMSLDGLRDATGHETALPKEVSSAGVRVQPTSIPIPAPVAQMGVQPVGHNVPPTASTVQPLPLTDDQIAVGLHQGITYSWRWLSEWCVKRLKQLHLAIQSVGGKNIRVKI